jgi:uncharacterized membrane protein
MNWEIAQPFYLAALVVLPLLVYYWRRSLVSFAPWQRAASLAIRVLLIVALVVALCGVRLITDSRQLFVVVAVDESLSISQQASKAAEMFVEEALQHAGDNQSARLQFALEPGDGANRHGTNLAAAIVTAEATARAGYVPRVVLLSDGNQTTGDARAAAGASTMPIWTVPLPGCPDVEVYVSAVETRPRVRQGAPFYVDVVVQSTHAGDGTLRLIEAANPVVTQDIHVTRGENRFRFRHALTGRRWGVSADAIPHHRAQAVLTAEVDGLKDTLPENNRASALVFIAARPRVLLIEGRPESARTLADALKRQYIDVETRSPEAMPDRLAGLQEYELLMLSNVPAASLASGQMKAVRQYVQDFGGGLIVLGGDRALTAGGYRGTILEDVLPLRCEVSADRPQPSLAMVLLIDRSASMQGDSIELAKQATRQAVEKLAASDQVGVIAFEDDSHWVTEGVQPCSGKQLILQQIGSITAGGGTNLYPAMQKAYLALHEAFADRKHMIVLSDGLSHPGDFETLTQEMAASGITVSTVAVGEQAARQLLQDIARRGKGHYYYCRDAAAVPSIFVLEATTAGKLGILEKLVSPRVVGAADVFPDFELDNVPPLLGYVQTIARPNCQLVLSAQNNDPLLVWWRYGRGVSVAFTSTVQSGWAPLWLNWPGLGPFWAQLVRHAMRQEESDRLAVHLERKDGRAWLKLDATDNDGAYINGAEAVLAVVGPDGKGRPVPLSQIAPGRYAAEFATPIPGPYRLETTLAVGDGPAYVDRRGLVVGYADELRVRPTDEDLLRSIAETTGGRYDPRPADVFAPPDGPRNVARRTTPCWPYFLTAAALIFLIDVALKRIDLAPKRS